MAKTKKIPAMRIVPMTGRPTYRAIGRAFSQKATDIPVADLTKAQIDKLKSDPFLSVSEVQIDVPDPSADDDGAAAGGSATGASGATGQSNP